MFNTAIHRTLTATILFLLVAALAHGAAPSQAASQWTPAPGMSGARSGSCSAVLQDGRILIAGGADANGPLSGVEMFGASGSFEASSPLLTPRQDHVCAVLPDGTVLVAGGRTNGGGITSSAEVFSPDTGRWSAVGAMTMARTNATATVLQDGRILIAGGTTSEMPTGTLEIFDPATLKFARLGAVMSSPRSGHGAAMLHDGRVLFAGGSDGSAVLDSVNIFDPVSGRIAIAAKLSIPRTGLTATALFDGNVLFAGGSNGKEDLATAEVYVAKQDVMSAPVAMGAARRDHMAISLPNNNSVLLIGGTQVGQVLGSSELYIPWWNQFQVTDRLSVARVRAAGVPLANAVIVAGGSASAGVTASAEAYNYATLTSNKSDYVPGQTVMLKGDGWLPGETVRIVLNVDPKTHEEVVLESVADKKGKFINRDYVVQQSDLGVTFYVTSTGLTSGRTAALLTFTDAVDLKLTVTPAAQVVINSSDGHIVNCSSGGGTCNYTYLTASGSVTLIANTTLNWHYSVNGNVTVTGCLTGDTQCTFTWSGVNGQKTMSVSPTVVSFVPVLSSISPTAKYTGDPAYTLTANGSNFVVGSVINYNGSPLTTTYVSATRLTATAPAPSSVGSVSITVTNPAPGGGTSAAVTLPIQKGTPTVSTWPTAGDISYGQTLASSSLSGGLASVPGAFTFTTSSTTPGLGTSAQSVTFTPTDATNYNTVTGTVNVTVNKATPTVSTWPAAGAISYGQTLASSALSGGSASVPGTFAFTTSSTTPGLGTSAQFVTFTPSDATNYNTVTGTVNVTVNKATPTVSTWPAASAISYGQTLASSTLSGGSASVPGTFTFTTSSTAPGLGTSAQSVTFTPTDATNYNTVTGTVNVTVNKATPTVSTWPAAGAISYGQTLASSALSGGSASVPGTFTFTTSSTAPGSGTPAISVTFTPTDATNYNTVTGTINITVNKATPTVSTWPAAGAISYGQTLASSTLSGGTASVAGTFTFANPGTLPNAGTASQPVTFVPSDGNYNTVNGSVSVTVTPAAIVSCAVSGIKPYTGLAQAPTVTCSANGNPFTSISVTSYSNPGIWIPTIASTDPNYTLASGQPTGQFIINTSLAATARSAQATLSWKSFQGASGYRACIIPTAGQPNDSRCFTTASLTLTVTGLTNNTAYTFQVTPLIGGSPIAGVASNLATATPKSLF